MLNTIWYDSPIGGLLLAEQAGALVGRGNPVTRSRLHTAPHMANSYDGNNHLIQGNEMLIREIAVPDEPPDAESTSA